MKPKSSFYKNNFDLLPNEESTMLLVATLCLSLSLIRANEVIYSGGMFGKFSSPHYPDTYPNDIDNTWNITVPHGFTIEVFFQYFDLEYSKDCEYDYVKISSNSGVLATFCGGETIGVGSTPGDVTYTSPGNQLTVQFRSDFSNEYNFKGFLAHYRTRDIDECSADSGRCDHYCHNYIGGFYCSCRHGFELHSDLTSCTVECSGNMLYAREGSILSPEYPLPYPRQLQCDWTIAVETGYIINLNFIDFDIEAHLDVECPYDYLQIEKDGNTGGTYCNSQKPANINTTGNVLELRMHTDDSGSGRGFKASYTTIGKPCVDIEAPNYGNMAGDDFKYRSTVVFSCNRGYILKGSSARSCRADGSWSGEPTVCEIVDCGKPPNVTHGSWTSENDNFTLGNAVTYDCDRFYELSFESESILTCDYDGLWVPILPVCEQTCGESDVPPNPRPISLSGKILGGRPVIPGSWPWQTLLRITKKKFEEDSSMCGGIIIYDQWILTAAHCLNDTDSKHGRAILNSTNIKIYVGSHDISNFEEPNAYPEKIIVHPDFDKAAQFDADIALIKLNRSLVFTPAIRPICLPEQSYHTDDERSNVDHFDAPSSSKGVIIGWGTSKYRATNNFLKEVYVSLASRNLCREIYTPLNMTVTENMFCAGEREGGKDACRGDSGGPFMLRNDDTAYFAHGLVSWGNGCGLEGFLGVYTRVENYVDWINNVIAAA